MLSVSSSEIMVKQFFYHFENSLDYFFELIKHQIAIIVNFVDQDASGR